MDILEGLNEGQRAAVKHNDGPMLVVAGAGTGKTQVITRRIARLIKEGIAKPQQLLALTFTEKAAREMADRLEAYLGWDAMQVQVMTFHGFGAELLNNYAFHIGRRVSGGLLTETQKALLLLQHINDIKLSYYGGDKGIYDFLEDVVVYIGNLQNEGVTVESYSEYVESLAETQGIHPQDIEEQSDLLALYRLYEKIKLDTGSYDYADQLQIPLQILQQKANVLERIRTRYSYILVDEYQDTNTVQGDLLRELAGSGGNLFVVGDDDQAIYGFRGADIQNILSFVNDFGVGAPVALTENYRSGQEILDAAYRVIQKNNPDRLEAELGLDKQLHAQYLGSRVVFNPYQKAKDEYDGIIRQIESRLEQGAAANSMAVLAGTHAPLRQMARELRERGIPYAISTQADIFEQTELIQLWYLLQWTYGKASPEAITHVALGEFVGMERASLQRVQESARQQNVSFDEALERDEGSEAERVHQLLIQWRRWMAESSVSRLVYKLVFESEVAARLIRDGEVSSRSLRVFEDLERLLQHMREYEGVAFDPSLGGYLSVFPKPPQIQVTEPTGDVEGVQLLTVHSSKGLEFPTVFLMGMVQRSWSEARGGSNRLVVPDELRRPNPLPAVHELRRLVYVAFTRAKNELIVSAATQTASGSKQSTATFIAEAELPIKEVAEVAITGRLEKTLEKLQRYYPLKNLHADRKLPFETADGWLDLSVTSLGAYDFCPYDFYLQNVLRVQNPAGAQLVFGTILHGIFESYLKSKLSGQTLQLPELLEILEERWSNDGYESMMAAENAQRLAKATVQAFFKREELTDRQVLGSEVPFKFEIPEAKLRLRGKMDAYFKSNAGIELRDFKTGRKTDADKLADEAKTNFQLRTYALAYEAMTGNWPDIVTLDYVVTGIEGQAELSARVLRNHRDKLITLANSIRAGEFAPFKSAFHDCAGTKYYGQEEDQK